MLEDIIKANSGLDVSLFFGEMPSSLCDDEKIIKLKTDKEVRRLRIFRNVILSLREFYATTHFQDICSIPYPCLGYYTENIHFEDIHLKHHMKKSVSPNGEEITTFQRDYPEWRMGLHIDYIMNLRFSIRGPVGFINLQEYSYKRYSLFFCIGKIKSTPGRFSIDESISKEHVNNYFNFVNLKLHGKKEQLLYIIRYDDSKHPCVNFYNQLNKNYVLAQQIGHLTHERLWLPYIFLDKDSITVTDPVYSPRHIPITSSCAAVHELYMAIENPSFISMQDPLTGHYDNSIRSIFYPYSVDYDEQLNLLREKLAGRRKIITIDNPADIVSCVPALIHN